MNARTSGPIRGAGMILIASAFIAASTLCAKKLGTGPDALNVLQITWGRYVSGAVLLALVASVVRPKFSQPHWPLHAARVFAGAFGVPCMFLAAALIPMADATAITFLNPVLAMIFAIPFLGERMGPVRAGCAALALIGALLLIRPGMSGFQPGAFVALAAAALLGMEVVLLKLLTGREGAFQIIIIANFFGALLLFGPAIWVWQAPTVEQMFYMTMTGVLMVTAQSFYTNALRLGDASFILPFSYATLLFAAFYDFVLFDVVPVWLSIAGGVLIVISGVVLAWRDGRGRQNSSSV